MKSSVVLYDSNDKKVKRGQNNKSKSKSTNNQSKSGGSNTKSSTKQKNQKDIKKLEQLVKSSSKPLYQITSVFPFKFFPNTLVIDKNKIDIIYTTFFWSKYIFTMLVEDITTAKLTTSPFFASITFELKGYEANPPAVTYLDKGEAMKAQHMILGLVKAFHEGVELQKLSNSQIRDLLQEIGSQQAPVSGAL